MPDQSSTGPTTLHQQATKSHALSRIVFLFRLSLLTLADYGHSSLVVAIVSAVVECCQLLALALPADPSRFSWNATNTVSIRAIARLIDQNCLITYFGQDYAFTIGSVVMTSLPVLLFLTGYQICNHASNSTNFIRSIRFILSLCSSVFYFPLLGIAFSMAGSQSLILSLLGFLNAVSLISTIFTCVATLFDYDLGSMSPWARAHSRFEILYLSYRTAVIVMLTVTSDLSAILVSFVIFSLTLSITIVFFLYVPYHHVLMTHMRCTLLALICWAFLAAFISVIVNDPGDGGAIFILYGAFWLIVVLSNLIVHVRIKYVRNTQDDQLPNAYLAEAKFRFELMDALDEELPDDGRLRRIDLILQRAEKCFPSSAILMFRAAHLRLTIFNNPFLAYAILARMIEVESGPDFLFMIMRLQSSYCNSQYRSSSSNNADVLSYNQYASLCSSAMENDIELVRSLLTLWRELSQPLPNADKLRNASHRISSQMTVAKSSYEAMLRIWSQSPKTLNAYAGFLEVLMQDYTGAQLHRSKAQDIKLLEPSGDSFASILFNEENAVVICSGEMKNLGEIFSVNEKMRLLFGSGIIGKNISIIVPEPFCSQHTNVIQSNLLTGRGSVLNTNRRFPCCLYTGYLIDCVVHVKSFVDRDHLSLVAVIEPIHDEAVNLIVAGSDGVITAVSESVNNWIPSGVVGGLLDDILPEFDSLQNQSNRVIITLHDGSKKSAHVKMERIEAHGDEAFYFYIARIAFLAGIADDSSQRSDFPVEPIFQSSVQAAVVNDIYQNADDDDDDFEEQSALAHSDLSVSESRSDHSERSVLAVSEKLNASTSSSVIPTRDKQNATPINPSVSSSNRSSLNDALENKRIRERAVQLWLYRASFLFVILLTVIIIISIIIKSDIVSSQQSLSSRISASSSRASDLVSLSLAINNLQLMANGILSSVGESSARKQIDLFSQALFDKDTNEWLSQESWPPSLTAMYDFQVSSFNTTLTDALILSVSESRVIRNMSLQEIGKSDRIQEQVALMCAVADLMQQMSSAFITQSLSLTNSYVMLQIILPISACIALFMLSMFLLRPALISSLDEKDQALLQLLQIPRIVLVNLTQTCLFRLQTLTDGPNESFNNASINKKRDESVIKPASSNLRFDPQQLLAASNRDKKKHCTQLATFVLAMASLYAAVVTTNVVVMISISNDGKTLPEEINWIRYEEYLIRRSFLTLNQVVVNNTKSVSPSLLLSYIASTSDLMNDIMYGDSSKSLPNDRLSGSNEFFNLQFNSICSLPSMSAISDCATFRWGVALNGLHSVFVEFLSLERNVLDTFSSHSKDSVVSLFSTESMTDLFRLENEFLRPAVLELVRLEENYIASNAVKATILDAVLGSLLAVVNIVIYIFLIRPALLVVAKEFSESSDLLQLLPNSNTLEADFAGQEENVDQLAHANEEDQLIVDFDDRNVAALAAHKARLKRRRERLRYNRISSISQFHGCLRSHPFIAYALSVIPTLFIVLKAYPSSLKFNSFDIGSDLILAIGSLLAGMAPIDAAILSYPLMSFDRFITRNMIIHLNSVAALASTICIILTGQPVEWSVVAFSTLGAALASLLNIWNAVPEMLKYDTVVIILAAITFGLSSGIICVKLTFNNASHNGPIRSSLHTRFDLILVGAIGGFISVLNGTGVGIVIYVVLVLFFMLNDNTALMTSIIVSGLSSILNIGINALSGHKVPMPSSIQLALPLSAVLMPLGLFINSTSLLLYFLTAFKFFACCILLWEKTGIMVFIGAVTAGIWACTAFIFGVSGTIQIKHKLDAADKQSRQNK